jgi:hypothetical protein
MPGREQSALLSLGIDALFPRKCVSNLRFPVAPQSPPARLRGPVVLPGGCGVWGVCWGGSPYFVQLVVLDQLDRLQLDRVGSIVPVLVLEQLQLQLDRLQLDRLQLDRLQLDRLQRDFV